MAEIQKLSPIQTLPGIKRDGTVIDGDHHTDGQWVRWQRGRPKKMDGFEAAAQAPDIVRAVQVFPNNDQHRIFFGTLNGIYYCDIATDGTVSAPVSRNPSGYTPGDYLWQYDVMYDSAVGSDAAIVIWHQNNSLANINDDTAAPIYYGDAYDTAALTEISGVSVSGGICVSAPNLIVYGSDGLVGWSNDNEPTNFTTGVAGFTRATSLKVVKGLPLKGAGYNPSYLLWSLDSVIRMYRVGGTSVFKFDHLTTESSILAQNSVIEYDGAYFWIGQDRFFVYAGGQVQELPNDMCQNWFFDNVNLTHANKIWATKIPRYGEIWWFYPRGDATECSHAIIYNLKHKVWYDLELARTAGSSAKTYRYPIWADGTPDQDTGGYDLCLHEKGYDRIKGGDTIAIPSWFETANFGYPTGGNQPQNPAEGLNRWTRVVRIEPDFLLEGDMTVQVVGREYPQGPDSSSPVETFDGSTLKIDLRVQQRHPRLRFMSNVAGGHYEGGFSILWLEPGDVRS